MRSWPAMPDTSVNHCLHHALDSVDQPLDEILAPLQGFPGRLVIKEIAPEKPFWTTDASPERAERCRKPDS